MASVTITLNSVLCHKSVASEVYATIRVGRDYAWGAQFKSRSVSVNRNATPRQANFGDTFTIPVKTPSQDVIQIELHERGLLSSDLYGNVEHAVAGFTMGTPMTLTIQGRSMTAVVTVIANGFGIPAPMQQVVHHHQTTYQVAPQPTTQMYVTTAPSPQPVFAVDPYGNPYPMQQQTAPNPYGPPPPYGQPMAQPQQQVYGQPQQMYGQPQPQQIYATGQPVFVQQTYGAPQQQTTTTTTYQAQPVTVVASAPPHEHNNNNAGRINLEINPFKGPAPTLF